MKRWLALSALVVALDRLSKIAVEHSLALGEQVTVTPFFDLVLVYNRGAAFSFLAAASGWQRWLFTALAAAASVWIVVLLRKHPQQKLFCWALALILGGALGNLIDRVLAGVVTDFLYFHIGSHYWPAFNIADSAISCGAVLLIWDALRPDKRVAPRV